MRALVPTGNPDSLVEIEQRPDPIPADDDVLIQVDAFSLNRADLLYLNVPASQWRVGIDFAGTVVKPAANGSGPKSGAYVMAHNPAGGGGAESATASAHLAIELPPRFEATVAAALPLAGLTAYRLVREARVKPGCRLLITGATGGVGHMVVELALRAGAEGHSARACSRRVGTACASWERPSYSRCWMASGPFDVLLESVGGAVMGEAVQKLSHRGLILWFGEASGQPVTLDFFRLFGGAARV